jgi:hypothetical protein
MGSINLHFTKLNAPIRRLKVSPTAAALWAKCPMDHGLKPLRTATLHRWLQKPAAPAVVVADLGSDGAVQGDQACICRGGATSHAGPSARSGVHGFGAILLS